MSKNTAVKKKIAFLGSGEMARHIAHYLVEDNQYDVAGCFDDYSPVGTEVFGYSVIGTMDDLIQSYKAGAFDLLINAIGFTRLEYRKELFERFEKEVPFGNFIHSSVLQDSTAQIGRGVVIFPGSILYLDTVIEDNVFIQVGSIVTDSVVKKHSMISGHCMIAGRASIGECCNIGISTTVSSDVTITDFVQTGAGTVVVKDITEPGVYVGVPARKLR